MATHPPMTTSPESEQTGDFVLFDESLYHPTFGRHPYSHPDNNLFPPAISDAPYPDILGEPTLSAQLNQPLEAMNSHKQYYSLGTSTQGAELPLASAPPTFNHPSVYSPFGPSEIPRSLSSNYMEDPMTSTAPDVLIHPPTFPYPCYPRVQHQGGHHSTPSASPVTSNGGFDGSGTGSEAGSTRNSPYNPPVGVETVLRDLAFDPSFVDPSLISNSPTEQRGDPTSAASSFGSPSWTAMSPPPVTSNPASPSLTRHHSGSGRLSPSYRVQPYNNNRRPSASSIHSWRGSPNIGNTMEFEPEFYSGGEHMLGHMPVRSPSAISNRPIRAGSSTDSMGSPPGSASGSTSKEGKDSLCPECSKCFRDLRAHQLTHQLERPEKCPIATCEYSKKGFARKYDCQRHTLTHYKGTMVCGFCPGSGSALEKSFNRADVFKRHLMAVHNVEQTPPNGRQKKSSNGKSKSLQGDGDFANSLMATGKCSTCNITFANAQHFYEHLDDCVLSKVVQEEPAAAANEHNLSQIKLEDVEAALSPSRSRTDEYDEEDEDEELGDADDLDDDENKDETYSGGACKKNPRSGSGRAPSTRSKSKTLKRQGSGSSRRIGDGHAITKPAKRRKKKNFPAGWGAAPEQMVSKRRCLMVFDGPKLLCKDEMMMSSEWEVRAQLGDTYVSDLDFWTMRRADAFLDAAPPRGAEVGGVR
ncbi:hypothetical protein EDC01DRAFT_726596 [Geopyxis carbonaria]|nr:hypothetical protein EDC01DRAFT_726596 [Geopyxis carbonaria]